LKAADLAYALERAERFCSAGVFTDEAGAAYLLGTSARTLQRWREAGMGPPATLAARWLYPLAELAAWIDAGGHEGRTTKSFDTKGHEGHREAAVTPMLRAKHGEDNT
jgi:hypothetical protein